MPPADDDLPLLADRLRLGIPTHGFDGRTLALRDDDGTPIAPIRAALELFDSALDVLDTVDRASSAELLESTMARAWAVEASARAQGITAAGIETRVVAVIVSAAVRATTIARGPDRSPSAVNRATLAWFESLRIRAQDAAIAIGVAAGRQSA